MGLDIVEMIMVLERELKIELRNEDVAAIWGRRKDIQVRDFVAMIENQVKRQNSAYAGSVSDLVRKCIAEVADVEESKITLDSWFIRDLALY